MTTPTHWMDDRGLVVTDDWLRNDPRSTSDYRAAYHIPCVMKRGKAVPINPAPMNAQTLYDRMKDALNFFGLKFHEMHLVDVKITALGVELHYGGLMVQIGACN